MSDFDRPRVLIVEDEALIGMLIEDCLEEAGMQVVGPVVTVQDALSLLQDRKPDAAVLDLNLAGESAVPVAEALMALGVPFIVATGYGAEGVPSHLQFEHVFAKPYDCDQLIMLLSEIFRRSPAATY